MNAIEVAIEQYRMDFEEARDNAAWARMMWQACITASGVLFLAAATFALLGTWLTYPSLAMFAAAVTCFMVHYARDLRFSDEADALALHVVDLEAELAHRLVG